MKTYQDLQAITDDAAKQSFLLQAILEYKMSDMFHWAIEGDLYVRQLNSTIMKYQKLLYTITGQTVPDNFTANHKCASNFFNRFVTQETQYLLGNGVVFNDDTLKSRLGTTNKPFDSQLQKAGKIALAEGVAYGFFNLDHIDVFKATEFVPLWDEEDGSLKAGIRFWQISYDKPLRLTLYELDGYTDYVKDSGDIKVLKAKRAYRQIVRTSVIDGVEIFDGDNYPGFPIIPLWGNQHHQSELIGLKGEIDAYDLIKSGFANDLDDASMIYWTIENAGGMDDIDLAKFIEHMKTVKATILDSDGAKAEAHTIDVPYQSRETYLTRLENDLYNDAMALNTNHIAAGNVTATAIRAAYQALDDKCDEFEYCVVNFVQGILELIGVNAQITFKRNRVANMSEETTMVLQAAQYLDTETILKHLPFLNHDEIDNILDNLIREEAERFTDDEIENGQSENTDGRQAQTDGESANEEV